MNKSRLLPDYLHEKTVLPSGDEYLEVRAQQNKERVISLFRGDLTRNLSQTSRGVSARVIRGGACGFASDANYSPAGIERVIREAGLNAAFLDSKLQLGRQRFAASQAVTRQDGLAGAMSIEQTRLIEVAQEIDDYLLKHCPRLVSRVVQIRLLDMEKQLLTTDGVFSHSLTPRSHIYVMMTVLDAAGEPVENFEPYGDYGDFAFVFPNLDELWPKIDQQYLDLIAKSEGVYPEPGRKTVILAADLAGILAHEAVGHTVEADFVRGGSVGAANWQQQVASERVTLVDFAHTALGERCPVPVYVDDEGTLAEDAVLIERGVLVNYLHNKESAQHFGHRPQGNARAYAFYDEPLIRMRNTCILPGEDQLDEMIASIDDGYYFLKTGNGQADATGEFMFGVNFGYEIKKGKLGRALRDSTISGVAFDVLKTVSMLSDDLVWSNSGMCGKKQMIPVGMGGPAIKVELNVGGR